MHIRDLTRILFDRFFSLSLVVETQFSRAYGKSRVSPIRICHFWCDFFPSPHTGGRNIDSRVNIVLTIAIDTIAYEGSY